MIGTSTYSVRLAEDGDASVIVSWFPTRESALLWSGSDVAEPLEERWLADQFASTRRYYALVDGAGSVCGCFSLRMVDDGRAHLGRVAVAPELRRHGVGSRLLEFATGMAREAGARRLTLRVYARNVAARRLYERHGFVTSKGRDASQDAEQIEMELSVNVRALDYVTLDVFTKTPFNGNPLAVVLQAQGLSDAQMQRIAGEFNLSETVFLLPPTTPQASVRARIFTPRRELPFAGHPTIGAAAVFSDSSGVTPPFIIDEQVGAVNIEADRDSAGDIVFWLTTPHITFYESLDRQFCAHLLGLEEEDVRSDASPGFVSAGSPLLFICLQSPEVVDRVQLQQRYLEDALGSVNSVGTFVFARKEPESRTNFDVYSRMFAPQTGIPEDPATGGATGPLAAYMMQYGLLSSNKPSTFTSEQGTKMGRQSILYVKTDPAAESIKVGGSSVVIARGTLHIPNHDRP